MVRVHVMADDVEQLQSYGTLPPAPEAPRRKRSALALGALAFGAAAGFMTRRPAQPKLDAAAAPWADASKVCLVHAAFGEDYLELSRAYTLPLKHAYADAHGYRVFEWLADTVEELAEGCGDEYYAVKALRGEVPEDAMDYSLIVSKRVAARHPGSLDARTFAE